MRVERESVVKSENQLPSGLGKSFDLALGLTRHMSPAPNAGNDTSSLTPGSADYENILNALAVDMADGIQIGNRKVTPLAGNASKQFQSLVTAELNAQKQRGDAASLETAIDDAKSALFDRIGNAPSNAGRDADAGLNVFEGYWKRHGGQDAAVDASYAAYKNFLAASTQTSNPD